MEKEKRITAPDGCEIEKAEIVDGVAVVTFREIGTSKGTFALDGHGNIFSAERPSGKLYPNLDKSVLPDRATAEAVLALCQLIQLRNAYNGDWVPDWTKGFYTGHRVSVIDIKGVCGVPGKIEITNSYSAETPFLLYFKDNEKAFEFLRNFRPLIEKLKPLYGIKEGGEE